MIRITTSIGSERLRNCSYRRVREAAQQSLLDAFDSSMHDHHLCPSASQGLIERPHPHLCPHCLYSQPPLHHLSRLSLDLHPPLFPERPIDRDGYSLPLPHLHLCLASMRKGIQIGVSCCVVGLSHIPHFS